MYTVNEFKGISMPLIINIEETFSIKPHSMFCIVYAESGAGTININGKTHILLAPAIYCFNELDDIMIEHKNNLCIKSIYFSPNLINNVLTLDRIRSQETNFIGAENQDYFYLEPFIQRDEASSGKFDLVPTASVKMSYLFSLLQDELMDFQNTYWYCRTRSAFLEILFLIQHLFTNSNSREVPTSVTDQLISQVVLYLHTHYQSKITIKELTDQFHINRTDLSKQFRSATGLSIMAYLTQLRIKMASLLIRDTNLPICEIIYKVGFNDSTHFGRTFRKYTGYTPIDYRRIEK